LLTISLLLGAVAGGGYGWYRYQYPYGATHRCGIGLNLWFHEYADAHGGNYPEGEDSAEALSQLATLGEWPETWWGQLAGKAISDEEAIQCVKQHGRLTEEFCSWHYVPGLRSDSDPGLALFWDKTGLAHNGMRQNPVRYEVMFVGGFSKMISESEWPKFLKRQEELRTSKTEP
jgi:hypothetical protein